MAGFWGDGIWDESYSNPEYWQGTDKNAPKKPGNNQGSGVWSPEFWDNEYWCAQYWYNTGLHELEYNITPPARVGGDDVYHRHKHKGWNKKAWLKKKKFEDDLQSTIEATLRPPTPKKKKRYIPDYEAILKEMQRIDDEEAAMLLL